MTRIKLILLSMVAVLGISAMASASASALETRYMVGANEVKGTEKIEAEGTVGPAQLTSVILGEKIVIECTNNKLTGATLEAEGKSKGEILFNKCAVSVITGGKREAQPKCVIKEITFKFTDLLIDGPGGVIEDEFKPSTGENFVTIVIENVSEKEVCTLKGSYETTGSYDAAAPEGELSATEHELLFTSTGSKVKLHKEPASFTNRTLLRLAGSSKGSLWLLTAL